MTLRRHPVSLPRMARRSQQAKYPRVSTTIPPHLLARLQAASSVLSIPVDELLAKALESHLDAIELDETRRELIDRFASETMVRTES